MKIPVIKTTQYGDYFIHTWNCPECGEENFSSEIEPCLSCHNELKSCSFDLTNSIIHFSVGTSRKVVSGLNRKDLFEDSCGECSYCFEEISLDNFEVDHIYPLSAGGTNRLSNLVASCGRCNRLASSMVFDSFWDKQKYLQTKQLAEQLKIYTK